MLIAAIAGLVLLPVAVLALSATRSSPTPVAWAALRTEDVHSLAFIDGSSERLLFGHHGGLKETKDGGRTWTDLVIREDAMSLSPAKDGSIVIAGHDVFAASRDGGVTWASTPTDLPNLDIHGFTRDPANPARMWAYLATDGLWESSDFGSHWTKRRADAVLFPTAVASDGGTQLLGVDAAGLNVSDDGGVMWTPVGFPATYPMTSFAASTDGTILYAGATDGLSRSADGGLTWKRAPFSGSAFALATSPDGKIVALVSRATNFYRSADGGMTWPGPD